MRCQTYEGGFGGVPGVEAHGGYSYCALAALDILQSVDAVDIPALAVSLGIQSLVKHSQPLFLHKALDLFPSNEAGGWIPGSHQQTGGRLLLILAGWCVPTY